MILAEEKETAPESRRAKNRPRLRTLEPTEGERHASWLELFFDLVFVLAVAKTAHILTGHTDWIGFLKFAALFFPIWYAWIGYTFYADRFETEEPTYRILMFAGMLAFIGLSQTLDGAFTPDGDGAFIACYVLVLLILVIHYARAAYYVPLARPYCLQFVFGIAASILILLTSLLFEPPVRYVMWGVSLLLELGIPFFNIRATRLIPIDRSHIPERLGLFTIIVLGEAVIATANGVGAVEWNAATIITASLGFAMAVSVWWINFDFVEDNAVRSNSIIRRFAYLYAHFFIVASIVIMGIGVEHAIKETSSDHLHLSTIVLLTGGTVCFLAMITIIRLITGICSLVKVRAVAIAVTLLLLYFGNFLPAVALVAGLFVVLLLNILIEDRLSEESEIEESEAPHLMPCEHASEILISTPRSDNGCEECRKNNYKWVHLRLCLACGHVGCCDTSIHKHATKHFHTEGHPIVASLEKGEEWAWCYIDERFVPGPGGVEVEAWGKP
ncbi:MAG: low temperature requirement protein A [Chloracidobacterium sp.]|nr:low temperature requirement protein A [Chloracidobacterium sp.]